MGRASAAPTCGHSRRRLRWPNSLKGEGFAMGRVTRGRRVLCRVGGGGFLSFVAHMTAASFFEAPVCAARRASCADCAWHDEGAQGGPGAGVYVSDGRRSPRLAPTCCASTGRIGGVRICRPLASIISCWPPARRSRRLLARTTFLAVEGSRGEETLQQVFWALADAQRPSPGMGASFLVLIPKGADEGNDDEPLCGAVACRPLALRNSDAKVLGSVVNRQRRRA